MFQKMIVMGRLGADPEMRYTPEGSPVTNLSIAVSDGKTTTWFRIVAWGKLAEVCNQYLGKGQMVLVEGKMQRRMWEDKEGRSRETWQLQADRVIFLSGEVTRERIEESEDEEEIPF